ncbi:MAG TPA: hypothetical protein VH394_07710 [Thermoanaerobaculia bacterium]|jgi:hypothetical protein|nr:hypothetical protein [Thermoanaerobaculia bacterium]
MPKAKKIAAGPVDDLEPALEPEWIDILTCQWKVLEKAIELLQELQELIPCPTPAEVAEMRTGARPISRHAYLIAQLQVYICDLEDVASDLKLELEYAFDPHGARTLPNFFNALARAVSERITPPHPLAATGEL